jgi:hypothetical protein
VAGDDGHVELAVRQVRLVAPQVEVDAGGAATGPDAP